ncbi:MAG TPA: hypothetical protein ENJ18_13735 [Nannocystis exedens]|nr:hypothetical protein [Nannocystis exedens]
MPPHLWARSERPAPGRVLPLAISLGLIIAGLLASGSARVALIGAGVVLLVLIPALIQHRLEALAERVNGANREQAAELQRTLKSRPIVSLFAPSAWVTLQDAQLALRLGDGRAAAQLFAETARRCRRPDAVMLVSAQAHALVVANDRKGARELLNTLAAAKLLGPRDQLDLGIVLLLETNKKSRQAMAYLEAARKTIGDHPWVGAAMALGLQRAERVDEAAELLEQAQLSLQEEPDPVVEVMVHRARREMRRYIEAQLRRERRARSRRATVVVTSEHAVSEIISGEISSREGSGAKTTQDQKNAAEESEPAKKSAEDAADREALQARGWQNPSSFAGRSDETAKPKVKVELRDTSVGEPIRIEGSYALKTKAEIEADRPKDRRRHRQELGPAIDIDLTLDEDDEENDLPAMGAEKSAEEPAETARTEESKKAPEGESAADLAAGEGEPEAVTETDPGAAQEAGSSGAADGAVNKNMTQGAGLSGGVSDSLIASLNENAEVRQAAPRDEASAMRRRGTLSESLVSALSALDSASLSASSTEREADAPQPTAVRKPAKASGEADAPVAMRRGRSSAYTGVLPKPPPFPSLGRGLGQGKFGAFAAPKPRIESDPSLASFKPEGGEKK